MPVAECGVVQVSSHSIVGAVVGDAQNILQHRRADVVVCCSVAVESLVAVWFVDNQGNVLSAKVAEDISSADQCLKEFAIRAARLSKFSSSKEAPARQGGEITYQFIPQR